jgi:hypothetical protein
MIKLGMLPAIVDTRPLTSRPLQNFARTPA